MDVVILEVENDKSSRLLNEFLSRLDSYNRQNLLRNSS